MIQKQSCEPIRVLAVDDNADDVHLICKLLGRLGCVAVGCIGSDDVLAEAQELRPHLVLIDLGMPQMDGYVIARMLLNASLPPFLLMARNCYADQEYRQMCLAAGFADVLVKPHTIDQLAEVVGRVRGWMAG